MGEAVITSTSHGPDPTWHETVTLPVAHLIRIVGGQLIWRDGTPPTVSLFTWCQLPSGDKFQGQLSFSIENRHLEARHRTSSLSSRSRARQTPTTPETGGDSTAEEAGQWYQLAPLVGATKGEEGQAEEEEPLGSIRVRMTHTEETILPISAYVPLQRLVLDSLSAEHFRASPLYQLGRLARNKDRVASILVGLMQETQRLPEFLKLLTEDEIRATTDPNTIFRGNSLATKSMDNFMKLVGQRYLQGTLMAVLGEIQEQQLECEIDPSRLTDSGSRDSGADNLANLKYYANACLNAIASSAPACPQPMKLAFANIRNAVKVQFPGQELVGYTAVSSFVFLRFFAAAILSPWMFNLAKVQPTDRVQRTLTLLSKTLQNLGNLSGERGVKEAFMRDINEQVVDRHRQLIIKFLDGVSVAPAGHRHVSAVPAACNGDGPRVSVLLEGYLTKRGLRSSKLVMGLSVRGRKNFKRRYFVLDTDGLTYTKDKGQAPIFRIRREEMLAVEPVAPGAFDMLYMFQVVQQDHTLYVCAQNQSEADRWMAELRHHAGNVRGQRTEYHP